MLREASWLAESRYCCQSPASSSGKLISALVLAQPVSSEHSKPLRVSTETAIGRDARTLITVLRYVNFRLMQPEDCEQRSGNQ